MDITDTIAIYGRSGHGKVLEDIARAQGYKEILWIDDDAKKESLSFMTFYEFYHDVPILLGIGDNKTRYKLFISLKAKGFSLPSIAHPSAIISPSAIIDEGTVIMPNAVINADAKISQACIINTSAVVEHDCMISEAVHISPCAKLAGNVKIAKCVHIGLGASVIQGLEIGENTVIGAGACLVENAGSNTTLVGVPAKKLKT